MGWVETGGEMARVIITSQPANQPLTVKASPPTTTQDKIKFMASGKEYEVVEVGFMTPEKKTVDVLRAGEVGRWVSHITFSHVM